MASRTWQIKVNGKQISVKASKAEVEDFSRKLNELSKIAHYCKEITGIIGEPETYKEYSFMSIFTPSGSPIVEPETFEAAKAELFTNLPELITADDIPAIARKASRIMDAHMPINDKRISREQHDKETEERAARNKQREEEATQKAEAKAKETIQLTSRYPHLRTVNGSTMSEPALASANLKEELRRQWPTVRFSVRSDRYSGGDSIDISWTDGPTIAQVQEISNKYETAHFDGMIDLESYVGGAFNDIFGGAGYVFEHRAQTAELYLKAAQAYGMEMTEEQAKEIAEKGVRQVLGEDKFYWFNEQAAKTELIPWQAEPVSSEETIGTNATVRLNPEKNGVEIKFDGKPGPDVLARLKSSGFRWSHFNKLWYARQSPKTIAAANELAGTQVEESATGDMDTAHEEYTQDMISERIGA